MTTNPRKLVFDDQRALQLVLGPPSESKRVRGELERYAGVTVHVRGSELTLEGPPATTVQASELTGSGAQWTPPRTAFSAAPSSSTRAPQ